MSTFGWGKENLKLANLKEPAYFVKWILVTHLRERFAFVLFPQNVRNTERVNFQSFDGRKSSRNMG